MGVQKKARKPESRFTFVLCCICLLAMALFSCGQQVEETADSAQAEAPDATFVNLTRKEYRGGILFMQISARDAKWYEADQRLEIDGLTFTTYNTDDGSASSSGEADKAVFYEASGDAEFSGYVHVKSAEGDVSFEASQITYKRNLDLFETRDDTEVTIKAKNQLLMAGKGLLFDVKQKYYEIRENVSGSVYQ